MRKEEILIMIPAHNEEQSILGTLNGVKRVLPQADIVVVNDGSSDRTSEIARQAQVTVLDHPFNLGDGAARQTGFFYALKNRYNYLIHMDADGQHSADDLPCLKDELLNEAADIVIGSRFINNQKPQAGFLRQLGISLFRKIVFLLSGRRITDPTSGFRALNRRALVFYAENFYPEYYPDADVIIASIYAGLKIKEVPVSMNSRKAGKSLHSGLSPFYYIYKMCLSILTAVYYRREGK